MQDFKIDYFRHYFEALKNTDRRFKVHDLFFIIIKKRE